MDHTQDFVLKSKKIYPLPEYSVNSPTNAEWSETHPANLEQQRYPRQQLHKFYTKFHDITRCNSC